MKLGERHTAGVPVAKTLHYHVLDEADVAGLAPFLLVPGKTVSVPLERGDHIVQAVAVDVPNPYPRAAAATLGRRIAPKGDRVILPQARTAGGRLSPPTVRRQKIIASVAVDVPDAKPMIGEIPPGTGLRDHRGDPFAGGVRRI